VLDEGFARDERERLAGKPRRGEARGNDANDFHAVNLAADEPGWNTDFEPTVVARVCWKMLNRKPDDTDFAMADVAPLPGLV
jgi:hypothetical protein